MLTQLSDLQKVSCWLGLSSWPLSVLAPLAVLGASSVIVWSTGLASFAPPDLDMFGWIAGLGRGFVQNAVFAMFTFSLSEDLGWRGYLFRNSPAV